ncbi:hypothetical protein GBA63_11380 [Rubrobacter tropicus]|uniref:Uncharacterized protein n=1 Tax=Rubrobacter tropicus TaxID=2653851 RepID=A0A6G8QF57_9ACTN|nr:hypothetical protein GBA63_11380 [Rubrobacter tropicus]
MSSPGPQLMKSLLPSSARKTSSPPPPKPLSTEPWVSNAARSMVSSPFSPLTLSLPSAPSNVSLPSPPNTVSLPR